MKIQSGGEQDRLNEMFGSEVSYLEVDDPTSRKCVVDTAEKRTPEGSPDSTLHVLFSLFLLFLSLPLSLVRNSSKDACVERYRHREMMEIERHRLALALAVDFRLLAANLAPKPLA